MWSVKVLPKTSCSGGVSSLGVVVLVIVSFEASSPASFEVLYSLAAMLEWLLHCCATSRLGARADDNCLSFIVYVKSSQLTGLSGDLDGGDGCLGVAMTLYRRQYNNGSVFILCRFRTLSV